MPSSWAICRSFPMRAWIRPSPTPGGSWPKHARAYADLRGTIIGAARAYAADVAAGTMPGAGETVRMDDDVLAEVLGRSPLDSAGEMASHGIPLDRDL